jgi:hypothetical protein
VVYQKSVRYDSDVRRYESVDRRKCL